MQVLFRFGSANACANERPSGWKKSVDLEYTESVKIFADRRNHSAGGSLTTMTEKARQAMKCMLAMQRHSWEQGVCAQALFEAGREDLWIPMAYDAIKRQSTDGRLAMPGSNAAVSDPAANGEVCLRAFEVTDNPFYLMGAQRMLNYLETAAPRTREGIICHNTVSFEEGFSPDQLWIDGLYMVPPFLAVMGKVSEAAKQIKGYIRHLFDRDTGLFFISSILPMAGLYGRNIGRQETDGR